MDRILELKETVKKFIEESELAKAFKYLKEQLNTDAEISDDLSLIINRFNKNKKEINKGIISLGDYNRESNSINESLLFFIRDIKESDLRPFIKKNTRELLNERLELYIEPFFQIYYKNLNLKASLEHAGDKYVDLFPLKKIHQFIYELLERSDLKFLELKSSNYRLIIVEGFPGQGKTFFCEKIIFDLLSTNKKVIDFPLYRVNNAEKFSDEPIKYIFNKTHENYDNEPVYFVLDGLNEINWSTKEQIKNFFSNIVDELKYDFQLVTVFITTRFLFIDANVVDESNMLVLALKQLDNEQREKWCEVTFAEKDERLKESFFKKITNPEEFLSSIIGIPSVLNFINEIGIAKNGQFLFKEYELVEYILKRQWGENKIKQIKDIEFKYFVVFFQYMAIIKQRTRDFSFSFFENETIDDELNKISFSGEKIADFLSILEKNFGKKFDTELATRQMLSSFFFMESVKKDQNKDDLILYFLDDSIYNFFLARFIYFFEISQNFPRIPDDPRDESFSEKALNVIWKCFVFPGLNEKIFEVLKNTVLENKESFKQLGRYNDLKNSLPIIFNNQLLYHYQATNHTSAPIDKCILGFGYFWRFLKLIEPRKNFIDKTFINQFISLIRLYTTLFNSELDLSYQNIEGIKMDFVNLKSTILEYAQLSNSNLMKSFLDKAQLNNIKAQNVNFEGVTLVKSQLSNGDFSFSNFKGANLRYSVAQKAIFMQANFEDSNLAEVDFTGATLLETNMSRVNLINANLTGANFKSANLSWADLRSVTIDENTNFDFVNFRFAKIEIYENVSLFLLSEKLKRASSLFESTLPQLVKDLIEQDCPHLFQDLDDE